MNANAASNEQHTREGEVQDRMDRESSVLAELVNEAYPGLTTLVNVHEWMANRFVPPAAFILTQGTSETKHSLTSYQVAAHGVIVLHYPQSDGIYQPLSAEPLQQLLRQQQFSCRGKTVDMTIEIDSTTLRIWRDKKDRLEITFSFTYNVPLPRENVEKVNVFDIQGVSL